MTIVLDREYFKYRPQSPDGMSYLLPRLDLSGLHEVPVSIVGKGLELLGITAKNEIELVNQITVPLIALTEESRLKIQNEWPEKFI